MARVLIAGGSGFIGTNLVDSCLLDGWEGLNFDREPPLTSFRLDNLLTNMDFDLSATTHTVGPAPFNLQSGVEQTVEWIQCHG